MIDWVESYKREGILLWGTVLGGGLGDSNPLPKFRSFEKLSQIPSSFENTSIKT
jgi:hypothetical protein